MPQIEGFKKYLVLVGVKALTFLCHLEDGEGVVLVWVVGEVGGDERLHTHTVVTVACTTWSSAWKMVENHRII